MNSKSLDPHSKEEKIDADIKWNQIGVNITVQSYAGTMYLGITACAKALPDADRLRDDMMEAFAELKQVMLPTNIADFRAESRVESKPADNSEISVKTSEAPEIKVVEEKVA